MRGELYIKGTGTTSPVNSNDPLVTGGWVDAWDAFGMSFENRGISRIKAPAPNKSPVTNRNVTAHGAALVTGVGLKEDRTITVPFHIYASSRTAFDEYYDALCAMLDGGWIDIKLPRKPTVVYHFTYRDCTPYTEYNGKMAIFALELYEHNPSNRI